MRIFIPIILFIAAIIWFLYTGIIKRNWKFAKEILIPTLFFGGVWGVIYYFIINYNTPAEIYRPPTPITKYEPSKTDLDTTLIITTGDKFIWEIGLCLKATEESTFLIPGSIFPQDVPLGKILQVSDESSVLRFTSDPGKNSNPLPSFKITLKKGVTLKINNRAEVVLLIDSGVNRRDKIFIIEKDSPAINP